ncbi:MAG: 8-oxo-dGTP diphosphatase MutT [Deltaproteobacteria bacterium]|nr:8-oxo-dGTP diphosphatase MutT [Deltaproteobacteria bacterium]
MSLNSIKTLSYVPTLDPKVVKVVACVIERCGEFLITKRLKTSHLGHCWEFPGGKVESGESLAECAVRECREEIDVVVKPLRLLDEISHVYPEKSLHLYFVLCALDSGNPRAVECAEWCWVQPRRLSEFEFPEADKKIIEALLRGGP